MSKKRNQKKSLLEVVIGVIVLCLLLYVSYEEMQEAVGEETNVIETSTVSQVVEPAIGELQMHVIDVGQGDSILLRQGEQNMLIDCGPKASGEKLVQYLKELGITKIDILVGTHPHEDHMGAMAQVINHFEIGTLYALDHSEDGITTKWYQEFLDAVLEKKVNLVFPNVGDEITLGQMSAKVLAPMEKDKDNQNNNSIVLRASFGETDILLTGDAEKEVEDQLLKTNVELESEILKVGHHGSDTSNSKKFLEEVNPECAVISAKKENSYGHPKKKVMDLLKKMGIKVYRTDEQGTIILTTDGQNITVEPEETGSYTPGK